MSAASLSIIAILLYLLSSVLVFRGLWRGEPLRGRDKALTLVAVFVALPIHAYTLYGSIVTTAGLQLGVVNMFALVSGLMVALFLFAMARRPVDNLAIALYPLAALSLLLLQFAAPHRPQPLQVDIALELHILLSIVAFSLLSIAALQAILLAVQERHLRNHQPIGFVRGLPPMESMESLLFQIIWSGFIMLTLALFNGLLYLEDMFAQHLVHKTVLSISAWLVFATLLWGRWRHGWRGRTAIRWTLAGLLTLLLAYFGSRLVIELILQR